MRRLINLTSISTFVQFALSNVHLFAASNDSNTDQGNSGLINAIIGVLLPALLMVGIGGGIYLWLRRKKGAIGRFFTKQKTTATWTRPQPRPMHRSRLSTEDRGRTNQSTGRNEQEISPERDPYSLESISLKELEQVVSLRESGRIQEYYEAIAMIIKRYVGEKYHIKTVEATTGQILGALPDDLTDAVADHVGEILRTCDMLHFSQHRPARSELNSIYQTAKEFLESQIVLPESEIEHAEDADENEEIHEYYRRMMR